MAGGNPSERARRLPLVAFRLCTRSVVRRSVSYPEWYDLRVIEAFAFGNPARIENVHTLIALKDAQVAALKPKKVRTEGDRKP